jgi:two-component system response regulator DesR
MIRVVLAEDQTMVLGALEALLEIESDLDVVAVARTGDEALSAALEHQPDVVVTDIEMPTLTGLELAQELKRRHSRARIVILTTFARPGYLRRALEAGASGYLLKDAPSHQLADAIRRVHGGGRVIDPQLATEAWFERQTGAEIGTALGLSEGTVRNYLSEAISKVGARNRVEAARMARVKGWL